MNDINDRSGPMPELEANSVQLTQLLEQARADIPTGRQWSNLSLTIAQVWDGAPVPGGEQADPSPELDVPVSPPPGDPAIGLGASKFAAQTGLLTSGTLKIAGVATLAGALATGIWGLGVQPAQAPVPVVNVGHYEHEPAVAAPALTSASLESVTAAPPQAPALETATSSSEVNTAASATPLRGRKPAPVQELGLLSRAREQLTKNPRETLALCRKHQQLFPQGQLAQEREVLLIDALQRLRREEEAAQKRDEFGKAFPDSPHQSRVKRSEP